MIFQEKKTESGYTYTVTDAFGTIDIYTPQKLVPEDGDTQYLDDVFMAIFERHKKDAAGTIEGTVKDTDISYKYKKQNSWQKIKKGE